MNDEIKVGEYVRTENGVIFKVVKVKQSEIYSRYVSKVSFTYCLKQDITKHSKNIIKLIEKGDWVNGQHVKEVKNGYVMVGNGIDGFQVWEEDIRTIVTKEQFKSVEYEVE